MVEERNLQNDVSYKSVDDFFKKYEYTKEDIESQVDFDVIRNLGSIKEYFNDWLDQTNPYYLCIKLLLEYREIHSLDSILSIPLKKIADRYISIVEKNGLLNLVETSNFISVAVLLISIKVEAITPIKEEVYFDDYGEEYYESNSVSAEERLKMALTEYLQDVIEKIRPMEVTGRIPRAPKYNANDVKEVVKETDYSRLFEAYQDVISKVKFNVPEKSKQKLKVVPKEKYTVGEKMAELITKLSFLKSIKFEDILIDERDKDSFITTFLAMLELLKRQMVLMSIEEDSEDIYIQHNENISIEAEALKDNEFDKV